MATAPYQKPTAIAQGVEVEARLAELSRRVDENARTVQGSGSVLLSGKQLIVDRTVRVSDIMRKIDALEAVPAPVAAPKVDLQPYVLSTVADKTYAPIHHLHAQADVTGLVAALGAISGGVSAPDMSNYLLIADAAAEYSVLGHAHAETDVTGLVDDLAGKQTLDADLTSLAALNPVGGDAEKAVVVSGANAYKLGQAIATGSAPQFTRLGLGVAADANLLFLGATAYNGECFRVLNAALTNSQTISLSIGKALGTGTVSQWVHGMDGGGLHYMTIGPNGAALTMTAAGALSYGGTMQATGLSVGRALTAGYQGDFYAAAADCCVGATTAGTANASIFRSIANGGECRLIMHGTTFAGNTLLGSLAYADAAEVQSLGASLLAIYTYDAVPLYLGTNNTAAITISTAQAVTCASTLKATALRASSDIGGEASCNSLTNVSTAATTGTGTVVLAGYPAAANSGWMKIYVGTSARYVPYWTSI
jgi:hypothetical protein